jgi:tetraacyldisaccharide 4'-kinase
LELISKRLILLKPQKEIQNQSFLKRSLFNIVLSPFSVVYGAVVAFRNLLFDAEILKSLMFDIPTICVGNLAVGGTGKTPHTEYLLDLLSPRFKIATLSRGYKRTSKGYLLAQEPIDSLQIGDEPYQIYRKYSKVKVAVAEKRVEGMNNLVQHEDLDVVILDDAYQHRYVTPGLSILLTDYSRLYTDDCLLPAGRLRESASNAKRADIIVVTKCPENLNALDIRLVKNSIPLTEKQSLFLSSLSYGDLYPIFPKYVENPVCQQELGDGNFNIILVAGIVKPEPLAKHLGAFAKRLKTIYFADHHHFTKKDFDDIQFQFEHAFFSHKLIVVTEKDAARILCNPFFPDALKPYIYAIPIKVKILQNETESFNQKIMKYVIENPRIR